MTTEADPIAGNWYHSQEKDQKFEVIEVDEYRGIVEVQYFDGDLDQIDLEEWYDLDIEPIEPPEDWTGPVDDEGRDDLEYSDSGGEDWSRSRGRGGRVLHEESEEEEEKEDEWGERSSEERRWEEE